MRSTASRTNISFNEINKAAEASRRLFLSVAYRYFSLINSILISPAAVSS